MIPSDQEIDMMFHQMSLRELSDWVCKQNGGLFDAGEFPAVDDLDDDEEAAAREEYEAMAEEILEHQAQRLLSHCVRAL